MPPDPCRIRQSRPRVGYREAAQTLQAIAEMRARTVEPREREPRLSAGLMASQWVEGYRRATSGLPGERLAESRSATASSSIGPWDLLCNVMELDEEIGEELSALVGELIERGLPDAARAELVRTYTARAGRATSATASSARRSTSWPTPSSRLWLLPTSPRRAEPAPVAAGALLLWHASERRRLDRRPKRRDACGGGSSRRRWR
jgi:hypothetical protein